MELIMLVGIIWGIATLILGILFADSSLLLFYDLPSIMITVGGSFASLMVGYPLKKLIRIPTFFRIALFPKKFDLKELIVTIVSYSEKARREGLLSLEDDLGDLEDPFLKKGLQLIVDGTDPLLVKSILENEVEQLVIRHDDNKRIFDDWATYAPAFGMIGTLMGLVMMLVNLSDRASIGPYLAVAIITTLYGAVMCYLILQPTAARLDVMTNDEVLERNIIIMGILSIQSGDNPRIVKDRLITFLAPEMRAEITEKVEE